MFKILLYIFLVYLLYQFIFNFLVPVYKTTQQVKKGFREMNDRMNDFANGKQQTQAKEPKTPDNPVKESPGDYIEFEEIK